MRARYVLSLLLITPIVATGAPSLPGFTVKSLQNVTAATPRPIAIQLGESALWHQAFMRCAVDPIRLTDPTVAGSINGKDPYVEVSARFECGVANWPDLSQQLVSAQQVIVGHVTSIAPGNIKEPISEHMANWRVATIEVREALKGNATPGTKLAVYFSDSMDVAWRGEPRFLVGEDGVWLLHDGSPGLTAPTALDFHPLDHRNAIWSLLQPRDP